MVEITQKVVTGDAPIILNNPKAFKPFEFLISMYGLPKYGHLDPTIFVIPVLIFFIGMMVADAVTGVLLVGLGLFLRKKYGKFGMLVMPAHFFMLLMLPFLFLTAATGIITLFFLDPTNTIYLLLIGAGSLAFILSKTIQAFIQAQIVLAISSIKLITGIETQKFERLFSARPKI